MQTLNTTCISKRILFSKNLPGFLSIKFHLFYIHEHLLHTQNKFSYLQNLRH